MKTVKISIIGAGLAGLTTAYLLKKKLKLPSDTCLELILFEATERPGGRAYTLREFSDDLYAEAGALSIANNETAILSLAKEINVEIIDRFDRQKRRFFENGKLQLDSDIATVMKFLMQEIAKLKQEGIISQESDWVSSEELKHSVLSQLDAITIIDYIQNAIKEGRINLNDKDNFVHSIGASLLGHYAGDITKLSAFDAFRYLSQYQGASHVCSVKGGNDKLPAKLYEIVNTDNCIKLHTPVTHILRQEDGKLAVTVKPSSGEQTFIFDYVIVATPLTALKQQSPESIKFTPALSMKKAEAIENTAYNQNVARIYFEVKDRFWENAYPQTGMVIVNKPTCWIEDHTAFQKQTSHAVLETHGGNQLGEQMQHSSDPINIGKNEITAVYGEEFEKSLASRAPVSFFWSKQPYQNGAYPYFQPKQKQYITELQKSEGPILFAGEYIDIGHPASMNGAVNSAYRVVEELQAKVLSSVVDTSIEKVMLKFG